LLAWPLAYVGTQYWLESFVERIEINPWIYLLATLVVVITCGGAICFQVIKAATTNPVHSLRQE
jgi:putative ABC transport system permease protein